MAALPLRLCDRRQVRYTVHNDPARVATAASSNQKAELIAAAAHRGRDPVPPFGNPEIERPNKNEQACPPKLRAEILVLRQFAVAWQTAKHSPECRTPT